MQIAETEYTKPLNLPRVNQDFIGIGHELEKHKKQRKKIQEEERAVANRVIHLEKERVKAQKKIQVQKRKLSNILSIKDRQEYQSEEKAKLREIRKYELDQLKKQNQMMRMIHKSNISSQIQEIKQRNSSDYSRVRKARIEGEYRKKVERNNDFTEKRDNWISLNISKEKGKMKVDKFYKNKNKEHLQFYRSRIEEESRAKSQRIDNIKNLEAMEEKLREDLQHTTVRASRMVELLNKASRTLSPMDTRSIEAELYMYEGKNHSRKTLGLTERESTTIKDRSLQNSFDRRYEVEENIELHEGDGAKKESFRMLNKRKKNRHINRFKQYQAF